MTSHMSLVKEKKKKPRLNHINLGFETHKPNLCILEAQTRCAA